MAGSVLQRIWDIIKPIPPLPWREWEVKPLTIWTSWDMIKPPPALAVGPGTARRRPLIFSAAVSILLIAASLFGVWRHLKSAPSQAESELRQGMQLASCGNASEALQHFNRAVAIWPNLTPAYLQRALVRQTLHQTDAALEDLTHALKLDPHLAAAHTAMGVISRDRDDSQRAAAELDLQPDKEGYLQRGQTYESLGQYAKAIEDYNSAIALLPKAPYVYRARANAELGWGGRDGASRDRNLTFGIEHSGAGGSQ